MSIPSALGLAVHVLEADAVIVGMGPGVVGTGTALGTTAIEVAPSSTWRHDSAASRSCACGPPTPTNATGTAASPTTAPPPPRSRTHAPWVAPIPADATGLPGVRVAAALTVPDPSELLEASGLSVTTMGRGPAEDPLFFRAAVAAGALAARLLPR